MKLQSSNNEFQADIDFLEQASRYLGRCRDVLKVCTSLPSSLWVLPLRPTQSSKTGLRVRNRKCQILAHPSNVRKFYWHAPENLYLVSRGHECQNKHLKTSMKGIWAVRKPMMRSDLASKAVWRPKQPGRICLKKSGVSVKFRDRSDDGVTGDGGYGDITGAKIFTGEVTS